MDARMFDRLTRQAARRPTRRAMVRWLAGNLGAGLLARHGITAAHAVQIDVVGPPTADQLCAVQGLTDCGGVCVDLSADPYNCGACGRICGAGDICAGEACVAGAVDVIELDNVTVCAAQGLVACGDFCTSTLIDSNNCGACGNSCPLGTYCEGGACLGGCVAVGAECVYGVNECCTGACLHGVCQCSPPGDVCSNDSVCCSDLCNYYGFCV
jgi:hypothetical protein